MSGSVNKALVLGRVGRDPEIRYTQSGDMVATLALATSERWTDKQSGDRREKTEWHRVVIFDQNIASVAERFVRKGSLVWIEGQLQTRKWTDQGGADRYTTEIVLQRFRGSLTLMGDGKASQDAAGDTAAGAGAARAPEDLDDDIPF